MASKVLSSLLKIRQALEKASRPCVLWSGGKDSMTLLALARTVKPDIECVFLTLPWMRQKLSFAHRVQEAWGLTVHDMLPASITMCEGNGRVDVMETYPLKGEGQTLTVARGTESAEDGQPFVCGVDWLQRPKALGQFPFDLALHGHKNSDGDPLSGPIPLELDVLQFVNGTETVFPLREWSDAEVWEYTMENNLPWDSGRYALDGTPLPDKRMNSDYYHACFACCRSDGAEFVACPKRGGAQVNSLKDQVPRSAPSARYINLRTEAQP